MYTTIRQCFKNDILYCIIHVRVIGYAHVAVIIQNDDRYFIASKRIEQGVDLITSGVKEQMLHRLCIMVRGFHS